MTFLETLCQALSTANVEYALVGGHAVALHGAVRGTLDIDLALKWKADTLKRAEQTLGELGLISRLPLTAEDVFHFRDEYVRNRNLTAWNFYNPLDLSQQVDLLITYDLAPGDTVIFKLDSAEIAVLNKQRLIEMKTASGRPQDLADIEALAQLP